MGHLIQEIDDLFALGEELSKTPGNEAQILRITAQIAIKMQSAITNKIKSVSARN